MSFPPVGAIDLMLNIPGEDNRGWYEFMKPLFMDEESRHHFEMPAQYMFKNIPDVGEQSDYIAYTIQQMDTHGIDRAMLGIDDDNAVSEAAIKTLSQPLLRLLPCQPQPRDGRSTKDRAATSHSTNSRSDRIPFRTLSAGPHQ